MDGKQFGVGVVATVLDGIGASGRDALEVGGTIFVEDGGIEVEVSIAGVT